MIIKSLKIINKYYLIYFSLIFLLILFTRYGYWNLTVIAGRWDEITYLLAGREITNGKIPYFDFWEIKTTIAFIPYIIANLFENKITSIRFLGSLSIFFSLIIFNYKIFKDLDKNKILILTIIFILLNSVEVYQSSGLTIFCYPLIFYSFFLTLEYKDNNYFKFLKLGFVVGILCLIRQNFYPIVLLNFLIFYIFYDKKYLLNKIAIYIFGGILSILTFLLPYIFIENGIITIYKSLILNSIAAGGLVDFIWNLREIIRYLLNDSLGIFFLITTIFGFYLCLTKQHKKLRISYILHVGYFLSIFLAFTGQFQLNNLIPSIIILLAYIIKDINVINIDHDNNKSVNLLNSKLFLLLFILILIVPVILNSTVKIIKNNNIFAQSNSKYFSYDNKNNTDQNLSAVYNIKKYIKKNDSIFSYDNFFYLLLDKELPTNILHPSIFFRLNTYKNIINVADNTDQEFFNILSKKPKWLIIRKKAYENKLSNKIKSKIESGWKRFDEQEGYHEQIIFIINN